MYEGLLYSVYIPKLDAILHIQGDGAQLFFTWSLSTEMAQEIARQINKYKNKALLAITYVLTKHTLISFRIIKIAVVRSLLVFRHIFLLYFPNIQASGYVVYQRENLNNIKAR